MKYIKSLDGIRGFAVMLVLFFHAGRLDFGWVGVQLFFVLSGYLITLILIEKKDAPVNRYLKWFWWRRSLRIFPIYFLYLFILALTWQTSSIPKGFGDYWQTLYTYTFNFAIIRGTGDRLYNHIWSLCVEEQFYLIWPLVIWLFNTRILKTIVLLMVISGPALRLMVAYVTPLVWDDIDAVKLMYYASPFYIEAFGFGASLVLWTHKLTWLGRLPFFSLLVFLLPGLLNCVLAGASIQSLGYPRLSAIGMVHIWGYTAINLASLLLIAAAINTRMRAFSYLFENNCLVYIGKISYGLYLIHNAVFFILNKWIPHSDIRFGYELLVLSYLIISLLVASLSYRFIEQPLLRLKNLAGT